MMRLRLMVVGVCLAMTGCRHKVPQAPVLPPPAPIAVAGVAAPKTPALLPSETPPSAPVATVPIVPAAPEKKVRRTKPVLPAAPPPVEVAAAPPPAPAVAIGALSAGASAESRKAVYDLIVANDKRIAGLSAGVKEKQKDQIARVRNFQADAQKALEGGDSEGAMTLATKAKVLLDEISR